MTYQVDMMKLKNLIKDYTKQVFDNIVTENKLEKICSFALVTDGSVMTLSARANTETHLTNVKSKMDLAEKTWITDEWALEDMSSHKELEAFLDDVEEIRFSEKYKHNDSMFEDYRNSYLNACVVALEELQKEKIIPRSDNFITLVQITDDDQFEGMYDRLNTPKHKKDYEGFISEEF